MASDGKISKVENLEGRITRITYKVPEGRSTLEVMKNYEDSLAAAGFSIRFTCAKADCGDGFSGNFFVRNPLVDENFEPTTGLTHGDNNFQRFLSAELKGGAQNVSVAVYVSQGWFKYPVYQLDVIQTQAMQTGMVDIDAATMLKSIRDQGRVALYGFTFDTGKADLKPGADAVLSEIAKLLGENKNLKLLVVGHTDSVGGIQENMDLSARRAQAVIQALVDKHGVSADTLTPYGVGPLCPVAANTDDPGRAKNRRVELVAE